VSQTDTRFSKQEIRRFEMTTSTTNDKDAKAHGRPTYKVYRTLLYEYRTHGLLFRPDR